MKVTNSQKAIAESITTGLTEREMVCLWGNQPNGKTHIFYSLLSKHSIGYETRYISDIRPKSRGEFTTEILEGVGIPMRADKVDIDKVRRQVLESYGEKSRTHTLDMKRRYVHLLTLLHEARIIPTLAVDSVELLPEKGYAIIKSLNEQRHNGERVGLAALLSGNFTKRKMPEHFWLHIKEVQVGRVSAEEVKEFVGYLCPGLDQVFTLAACKKLAECASTLEMSRVIRNAIDYWRKHTRRNEPIDTPIIKAAYDKVIYAKHRLAA